MADSREAYREGVKLKDEKKYDEALAKFQQAKELNPTDTVVLHAMVQCFTELTRHEEAIELGKQVVEREPNDYFSYIALSRALQRAGMIPEAEYAMMQGQQVQMRVAATKRT